MNIYAEQEKKQTETDLLFYGTQKNLRKTAQYCFWTALNAKQEHRRKKIKLILAIPYPEQADEWDRSDVDEYERIKALADEVVYISKEKKKGCMHKRNRYMVDNSSLYDKKIGWYSLYGGICTTKQQKNL